MRKISFNNRRAREGHFVSLALRNGFLGWDFFVFTLASESESSRETLSKVLVSEASRSKSFGALVTPISFALSSVGSISIASWDGGDESDRGINLQVGSAAHSFGKEEIEVVGLSDSQAEVIEVNTSRGRSMNSSNVNYQLVVDEDPDIIISSK